MAQTSGTYNAAQAAPFVTLASNSGLNAYSYANGAVSSTSAAALLASHPVLAAKLGAGNQVLALGSMGAGYATGSTGWHTYSASATYSFDFDAVLSNVSLNLLDFSGYNGGFQFLKFTVTGGTGATPSTTLVDKSFSSYADAQAYFTDNLLLLTPGATYYNSYSISYSLTTSINQGAGFNYAWATTPAPEPGEWMYLIEAFGALYFVVGHHRRKQAAIAQSNNS